MLPLTSIFKPGYQALSYLPFYKAKLYFKQVFYTRNRVSRVNTYTVHLVKKNIMVCLFIFQILSVFTPPEIDWTHLQPDMWIPQDTYFNIWILASHAWKPNILKGWFYDLGGPLLCHHDCVLARFQWCRGIIDS